MAETALLAGRTDYGVTFHASVDPGCVSIVPQVCISRFAARLAPWPSRSTAEDALRAEAAKTGASIQIEELPRGRR